jgi:Xaa-Pro aminopeptidase
VSLSALERSVGARRASRGADAGLAAARATVARAELRGGSLWLDGRPLTSDRVREEVRGAFERTEVDADELTVSHGPQAADPDSLGEGAIARGAPIVIDLYPRDPGTAVHADSARTIAVEPSDELRRLHAVCVEILETLAAGLRAGVSVKELWRLASAGYAQAGAVPRHAAAPGSTWFPPLLGHGVGLTLHEPPFIGEDRSGVLGAGDLVALEPALYRDGWGGCRVENLYLIDEDGCELLIAAPIDLDVGVGAGV